MMRNVVRTEEQNEEADWNMWFSVVTVNGGCVNAKIDFKLEDCKQRLLFS